MKNNKPLVSIIIPVYNREKFILNTLKSCSEQVYKNIEIICIDDNSTDNSKYNIECYVKEDARVKLFINNNKKGVSGARNTGLTVSKGSYIAFLDSDDQYKPHHISKMVYILNNNKNIDWIFSDFERIDINGNIIQPSVFNSSHENMGKFITSNNNDNIINRKKDNIIKNHILYETIPGLHTSVIRRKIIESIKFDEELQMFEDWKFRLQALLKGYSMSYIHEVHHEYYIHNENLCSSSVDDIEKMDRTINEFLKLIDGLISDINLSPTQKKYVKKKASTFLFWEGGYKYERICNTEKARNTMLKALSYSPSMRLFISYIGFELRNIIKVKSN